MGVSTFCTEFESVQSTTVASGTTDRGAFASHIEDDHIQIFDMCFAH